MSLSRFFNRIGNSIQKIIDRLPWRGNNNETETPENKPSDFPGLANIPWHWGNRIDHWPETINLEGASITKQGGPNNYHVVRLHNNALAGYPKWFQDPDPKGYNTNNVNGTIWIIRKWNGQWIIGSIDYLRVGQLTKGFAVIPQFLIENQPGEFVGVMISTTARQWDGTRVDGDPDSPYRFRSNVVWTRWP